jgi:hypothetical protein
VTDTPNEFKILLDRVRAASGPDHELEACLVWHFIIQDECKTIIDGQRYVDLLVPHMPDDYTPQFRPYPDTLDGRGHRLTTSLDELMANIRAEEFTSRHPLMTISLHSYIDPEHPWTRAEITWPSREFCGANVTEPLALCEAFVRAMIEDKRK